jgi:hypothetical protein
MKKTTKSSTKRNIGAFDARLFDFNGKGSLGSGQLKSELQELPEDTPLTKRKPKATK